MSLGGRGNPEVEASPPSLPAARLPDWLTTLARSEGAGKPMRYLGRHSRSFRFAARFLPSRQAEEVAGVYAFCRFTDNIVDGAEAGPGWSQPPEALENRLDEWLRLARAAHAGNASGLPLLDGPILEMGRRGIPFRYVEELVEGMRMDVRPRLYATSADLEAYTFRVAAVVGKWLTELCGVRSAWVLARAADLGHAMQLTNILRDVGEDWRRGRLYLPVEALARHGLAPADIGRGWGWKGAPAGYRSLMEEMADMAEARYQSAFQGIPFLPDYFQRPVLVSALVYREILSALRRNGWDNFRLRAASTPSGKLAIGMKAYWILPSLRTLFPPRRLQRKGVAYGH